MKRTILSEQHYYGILDFWICDQVVKATKSVITNYQETRKISLYPGQNLLPSKIWGQSTYLGFYSGTVSTHACQLKDPKEQEGEKGWSQFLSFFCCYMRLIKRLKSAFQYVWYSKIPWKQSSSIRWRQQCRYWKEKRNKVSKCKGLCFSFVQQICFGKAICCFDFVFINRYCFIVILHYVVIVNYVVNCPEGSISFYSII